MYGIWYVCCIARFCYFFATTTLKQVLLEELLDWRCHNSQRRCLIVIVVEVRGVATTPITDTVTLWSGGGCEGGHQLLTCLDGKRPKRTG